MLNGCAWKPEDPAALTEMADEEMVDLESIISGKSEQYASPRDALMADFQDRIAQSTFR
jgi:hypothetical protein